MRELDNAIITSVIRLNQGYLLGWLYPEAIARCV